MIRKAMIAGYLAIVDDATRRAFVGAAYRELVGYDPFADHPEMTTASGFGLLCDTAAEHESAACHCRTGRTARPEHVADAIAFRLAGFDIVQTGGGCTAWRRDVGHGHYVLITDSEGTDHALGVTNANNGNEPDCYLVGLHDDRDHGLPAREAADVRAAIAAALELEGIAKSTR